LLLLALLENLIVHCHIGIDLVQEIWVKFKLQLIVFIFYLLRILSSLNLASIHFLLNHLVGGVHNVTRCEFLLILVLRDGLIQIRLLPDLHPHPHHDLLLGNIVRLHLRLEVAQNLILRQIDLFSAHSVRVIFCPVDIHF